jgi:WD40 repeat protein
LSFLSKNIFNKNKIPMAKMKSKYILYGCSLIVLMIVAFSCSKDVNLDNPLDPNVQLSSPDKLQITYMKETTLQLSWNRNYKEINDEQAGHVFTLLEQSTDGNTFVVVDTIKGSVSAATISEEFIPNTTYYFRIRTLADSKTSGYSNVVSSQAGSLYSPSNLTATIISETQRTLSWQDNSTSEIGFIIKRKLGKNGNYNIIGQVPANTTTFIDSSVIITDTAYSYAVCASFSNGKFSIEDTMSIDLEFPAPDSLKINSLSSTSVKLIWSDNSSFEDGFIIERHERGAGYSQLVKVPANTTSFTDNTIDSSKDYFYRVSAYTKYTQTKFSNEIIIAYYPGDDHLAFFDRLDFGGHCPVFASRDGKYIFFNGKVSENYGGNYGLGNFMIYNTYSMKYEKHGYHGTDLYLAAFSNDDQSFATISNDGFIKIWDYYSLAVNVSIPCTVQLNNMVFSGDDSKLICSATDNRIYCWNTNDGTLLYVSDAYSQPVSCLKISSDGRYVFCASGNIINILNPYSGNILYSLPAFPSTVNNLKCSNNNLLAVLNGNNKVDIYDMTTKVCKYTLSYNSGYKDNINFTDDGKFLITNTSVWRLSDLQLVRNYDGDVPWVTSLVRGHNLIFYYIGHGNADLDYRYIHYKWDLVN